MSDTISGADFDCRYIAEGPYGAGRFSQFIKQLGIVLPSDVTLRDTVRLGWISPALRIAIPREYFEDWEEYPVISRNSAVRPEHQWADWVVRGDFSYGLMFPKPGPLLPTWYLHPFDTDDVDVREVLEHAVSVPTEPAPFEHPRGGTVHPYVDFFRYWEAYRLMESLKAARLFAPILNTPFARDASQQLPGNIDALIDWSDRAIGSVHRRYGKLAPTFEWISLYRTLLAAKIVVRDKHPNTLRACTQLLRRIGRSPEEMKDDVQQLLELWNEWHLFERLHITRGAERHLQQDIKRAVDFIATVTKRATDYRDSRWYITDRNSRRWSELREALPYEAWLAQESFPRRAAIYMRHARKLRFRSPVPITEEQFRSATAKRWPNSYGFRRFTILFKRLHDLLNKDRDVLLTFVEHNVVDYMILGCLVVERMVAEWWRSQNPSATETPTLDVMLVEMANALTSLMGIRPVDKMLKQNAKKAKLHALKKGDKLPLLAQERASGRQFIFTTLHNLRVLRNYSAHHDCLDFDLTYGREGARAMRVIVGAAALILALPT